MFHPLIPNVPLARAGRLSGWRGGRSRRGYQRSALWVLFVVLFALLLLERI